MANIELRRKKRIIIPIAIGAGALLAAAGSVLLFVFVFLPLLKKPAEVSPDPVSSLAPSSEPTPEITDAPEFTAPPSEEPSAEPTYSTPVRISEENCRMLLTMRAVQDTDGNGGLAVKAEGSCAIEFVNNRSDVLYSAELNMFGLNVLSASVDGVPVRFSVSEEGVLTIPFIEALPINEVCVIYFEFTATVKPEEEIALPCFSEDDPFELCAEINSELPMIFLGAGPLQTETETGYTCFFDGSVVRMIKLRFHF